MLTLDNLDNSKSPDQPKYKAVDFTHSAEIIFDAGSAFEYILQAYTSENGVWNYNNTESIAYFGWSLIASGSNPIYQGIGMKGNSANYSSRGARKPTFDDLELNSTEIFSIATEMYIAKSLDFNVQNLGGNDVIITSTSKIHTLYYETVVLAVISTNYTIKNKITCLFTSLFICDLSFDNPLYPLTVDSTVNDTITDRYLYSPLYSITYPRTGLNWRLFIGGCPLPVPPSINVIISLSSLPLLANNVSYLWPTGCNGCQYINLIATASPNVYLTGNCPLKGKLTDSITDLYVISTEKTTSVAKIVVWSSPPQERLYLVRKIINEIRVVDQQGVLCLTLSRLKYYLNVSALPEDTSMIEIHIKKMKSSALFSIAES